MLEMIYLVLFLLSVAAIIAVFVIASHIGAIKRYTMWTWQITKNVADSHGFDGLFYACSICKKQYRNKQPQCPHCGAEANYKK